MQRTIRHFELVRCARYRAHLLVDQSGTRRWRSLHTLRPEKLTDEDFIDFSGRVERSVVCGKERFRAQYVQKKSMGSIRNIRFPEGSAGFLYYHPTHPVLGSVRLRLAKSPALFHTGTDLVLPNGAPWSIPLMKIVLSYAPLRAQLEADGLVSAARLRELGELAHAAGVHIWQRKSQVISSLADTFELDLAVTESTVWVLRPPKHLGAAVLQKLFTTAKGRQPGASDSNPYSGSIMCRFERAEGFAAEPSLVVRVLKIVRPIQSESDYDGWVPAPVAGELLRVQTARGTGRRGHNVWSCTVEQASHTKCYTALKPLFEDA